MECPTNRLIVPFFGGSFAAEGFMMRVSLVEHKRKRVHQHLDLPLGFTLPPASDTSSFGGDAACVPWALRARSVVAESEQSDFCQIVSYWAQLFCDAMVFDFINQWCICGLGWVTCLVPSAQNPVDCEVFFKNLSPFKDILVHTNLHLKIFFWKLMVARIYT